MADFNVRGRGRVLRQHYAALVPGIPPETLLLWPPNLFALTSDIFSRTGAYHGAICPPVGEEWPPPSVYSQLYDKAGPKIRSQIARLRDLCNTRDPDRPIREKVIDLLVQHIKALEGAQEKPELCVKSVCVDLQTTEQHIVSVTPVKSRRSTQDPADSEWARAVQETARQWRYAISKSLEGPEATAIKKWITQESEILADIASRPHQKDKHLHPDPFAWLLRVAPPFLIATWAVLRSGETNSDGVESGETLDSLNEHWTGLAALLTLHAIADEACMGMGIWTNASDCPKGVKADSNELRALLDTLMFDAEGGASLATIPATTLRILPKRHTPEIGITLRSFSSYVGHHRSSVRVTWDKAQQHSMAKSIEERDRLSVLLLPWPLTIRATDFSEYNSLGVDGTSAGCQMSTDYGLFQFNPTIGESIEQEERLRTFEANLRHAIADARAELGQVDMVVLPEMAIASDERVVLDRVLADTQVSCYVAGVREEVKDDFPKNAVYCKQRIGLGEFPDSVEGPGSQSKWSRAKHHRWKLTDSQITQYSLACRLPGTKAWWEAIRIGRREVRLINVSNRLTICPLICEDLARQDPIADLIRTIGPSLVIAILMDGPQILERWSARYASVLNDDPGSSVLTLTSVGMTNRFGPTELERNRLGVRARAVALWRDCTGSREITLSAGNIGVALSLNIRHRRERVADGRRESAETYDITLGGVHEVPPRKKGQVVEPKVIPTVAAKTERDRMGQVKSPRPGRSRSGRT